MKYAIVKDVIQLLEEFDAENKSNTYSSDVDGFKAWLCVKESGRLNNGGNEPYWEGKEEGRSLESAISTSLVHLNRYAKSYSKSAISESDFATQEDFALARSRYHTTFKPEFWDFLLFFEYRPLRKMLKIFRTCHLFLRRNRFGWSELFNSRRLCRVLRVQFEGVQRLIFGYFKK